LLLEVFKAIPKIISTKGYPYFLSTNLNNLKASLIKQLSCQDQIIITADCLEMFFYLLKKFSGSQEVLTISHEMLTEINDLLPGCYDTSELTTNELAELLLKVNSKEFDVWISRYYGRGYPHNNAYSNSKQYIDQHLKKVKARYLDNNHLGMCSLEGQNPNMWMRKDFEKLFPLTNKGQYTELITVLYYFSSYIDQQNQSYQSRTTLVLRSWLQQR
jgi:hypothetical protein